VGRRFLVAASERPILVAVTLALVAALIIPPLLASYWIFLTTAGMLTAIVAMGLAIIVGWVGEVSLMAGALLGTSAYISGYLLRQGTGNLHSWPFLAALVIGITCAAGLSAVAAIPTARLSGVYVMVLTLGIQITVERTLFSFPWIIGGFGRNVTVTRPEFLGISFDSDLRFFYLCFAVMLGSALLVHALRRSRHGRAMNLIRTDRRAAAAVGISPWRYKVLAFAIGGGLIGLAGAFTSPLYRAPPTPVQYVAFQSLFLLAIPVVAGTGSLVGIVAVAIAFALIPQSLESHHLSPYLLGGIGLMAGTVVGARGIGGVVLDMIQTKREVALLGGVGRAALGRETAALVDQGALPGGEPVGTGAGLDDALVSGPGAALAEEEGRDGAVVTGQRRRPSIG
jgi:ABC-type branched-subunit amino acid transport system permease subunit